MKSIINWLEKLKSSEREEKKIINLNVLNVKLQNEIGNICEELNFYELSKDVPGDFITSTTRDICNEINN